MAGEVPDAPEGLAVHLALIGPPPHPPGGDIPVRRQRGLVLEVFPTLPALVRLLPCVDSAVLDQGGLPHEGLAPHATLEGPLVTVDGLMLEQEGHLPEASPTFAAAVRASRPVWICR